MSEEHMVPPPTYDPETLREIFEDWDEVRLRIGELPRLIAQQDVTMELLWRGELVTLLRSTDRLDEALNEARAAVDRSEIARATPAQQHIAQVRLAKVHVWRGDFAESTMAFTELGADAWRHGPLVDAYTHEEAGMNDFAQGHWADAVEHFTTALRLRSDVGTDDPPERDPARFGLAAAQRRLAEESS